MTDAVIIGSGPNGLVAANVLADAGWDVLVLEQQPQPGGGVRTTDGPAPGFRSDSCSAFYPLAAASRAFRALELERHGLQWTHAPAVLAHPLPDGRAAVLERDPQATAEWLDRLTRGDGDAWLRLYGNWMRVGDALLDALFTPFPPVRAGLRVAARLRLAGTLRLARQMLLPVRRLAREEFGGDGSLLVAGCALHADLAPEETGSGAFGWLMAMAGQQYGFPVPVGGAQSITDAMIRRLESRGGRVVCSQRVSEVVVRRGRAVGVRTGDGSEIGATRAVIADVAATDLYGGLVAWDHLPSRLRDDLRRFQWDYATVKVDWALDRPVPWTAPETARAGTVHLGASMDELTQFTAQLAMGRVPDRPFMLVGQMTTADPSRSPAGKESLWAYTHVPREVRGDAGGSITGSWDDVEAQRFADRMTAQIERFAPGFAGHVIARRVTTPKQLEDHDANLVGGAINGGTTSPHQMLVFRPVPGLGRPETPVTGLYLGSASAHPGGGVHGACGANAARAALRQWRVRGQRLGSATARTATQTRQESVHGGDGTRTW